MRNCKSLSLLIVPSESNILRLFELNGSLDEISKSFNKNGKLSPFLNTGLMINGQVMTLKSNAVYKGKQTLLKDILHY